MPRPFGVICRASLASMCLVSTLVLGQTAQHPSKSARDLVKQFKRTAGMGKQFDVAEKIVTLRDHSVLQDLQPWLSDEDIYSRSNAAFIFASLGDDRGFQIIKTILEGHSGYVINDLSNPDPRLQIRWEYYSVDERYYAAHLFGDLKDARAVPILVPLLKDKAVNGVVPWSLGQIGDKSAIPPLIEMLDDKNPDMRALAIYALQTLNAKQALLRIRALVNDDQRIHFDGLGPVSQAAKEAIATLEEPPWASVEGKPVATRVITDTDNFSPTKIYYGECQLKYVANGKEHLLWAAAYSFSEESVVRQKMSSCPVSGFVVRYNPKDATDAIAVNSRR